MRLPGWTPGIRHPDLPTRACGSLRAAMQLAAPRANARAEGSAPAFVPVPSAPPKLALAGALRRSGAFCPCLRRGAGLRPPLVVPTLSLVATAPAASVRPHGGSPQACALPRSGGYGLDARPPASRLPRAQPPQALSLRPRMHEPVACYAGSSCSHPARRRLHLGQKRRWARPASATAVLPAAVADINDRVSTCA